ncbi:MAG: AraC family transcriptional regulator [Pseudomonadales bacterium]
MSKTVEEGDPLSLLLRKVSFAARIFFSGEYCGNWGVDTSGSRHVPFHLVTQGEGWLHADSAAPRRLLAGQLVLFPNDAAHVLTASGAEPDPAIINRPPPLRMEGPVTRLVCGYFLFNRRVAEPLLASLPPTMVFGITDSASASARELAQLWMREAAQPQLGSDLAIDRLAELVFVQMLRAELAAGRLKGLLGALADPSLGPVLALIHRFPGREHSVPSLATIAHMSESAFSQRFKREVGLTPGQYVKHWRMQAAANALTDTVESMGAIAENVGYESEAAFRKAFRAYFGVAPGRWRRESRVAKERGE